MLQGCAMGLGGMIIAIYKGWTFGLVLLFLVFPLVGMMVVNAKITSSGVENTLKAYGQSAGYADQALNAIKVVVAFGMETTEIDNYSKYLVNAKKVAIKSSCGMSFTHGLFYGTMYYMYCYAFWMGAYFVRNCFINPM